MPRPRIAARKSYPYRYTTQIRVRDVNYGGHLGNDSVAGLIHEARLDLLRGLGTTELDLGDGRTGIVLSDLVLRFLAEGRLFDEIVIESAIDEVTGATLRMFHRIQRGDTTLALAEAGVVAFDYARGGIGAFPGEFMARVRQADTQR